MRMRYSVGYVQAVILWRYNTDYHERLGVLFENLLVKLLFFNQGKWCSIILTHFVIFLI